MDESLKERLRLIVSAHGFLGLLIAGEEPEYPTPRGERAWRVGGKFQASV